MRRFTRIPRWAWLASLALHAAAALGLYLLLPDTPAHAVATVEAETTATEFSLGLERPSDRPPADELPIPRPAPPAPPPTVEPGRLPTLTAIPPAVSNDFQAILRDLAARPTPASAPPEEFPLDFPGPDAKPAPAIKAVEHAEPVGPVPPVPAGGAAKLGNGKPIHGPLPDGMIAVYLLDRSASMGLNRDTFAAARAALLATVNGLSAGARFQVLAYHSAATPVVKGGAGGLLLARDDVLRQVGEAVAGLKAEGNSAHEAGLKAAVALGADYVIWITDVTDEELAKTKRALKGAAKPVAVYVARAANGVVAEPELLR